MLATQRFSNETLAVLQHAPNAERGTLPRTHSIPPTEPILTPAASTLTITQLQADLVTLQAELTNVRAERDQLRGLLADLHASQVQLRALLADTQVQLSAVEAERHQMHQQLLDLKRKPFTTRSCSDDTTPAKGRSSRWSMRQWSSRPSRIDQIQTIPAGEHCPECGTTFTGIGTTVSVWSKISSWCARR